MANPYAPMCLKTAREVLGVSSLSTAEEIQRAFRRAAKRAHPDSGGDPGAFQQLTEALARLTSPLDEPPAAEPRPRDNRLAISPQEALIGGLASHTLADGRTIRITLPAGLRNGDKVRAGAEVLKVYVRAEAGVLVRGDDVWMTIKIAPATLKKGGRVGLDTPLGRRIVWITAKASERGLVRLEGQGLPPRGRHAKGHLFLRLAAEAEPADSAALSLLRRFAAAWAA